MVGIMVTNGSIELVLDIVEDGGEMVVVSLVTWYVYRLNQAYIPSPLFRKRILTGTSITNNKTE
jgi:hypothetical protein